MRVAFVQACKILRVAFSVKLKCLPRALSKHDVSAAWRFHWMIQAALHTSNTYQVHTKHRRDTANAMYYFCSIEFVHIHTSSLKMMEICQNSKGNNEWQIARNWLSGWRSVNALASHRCDPCSIPGVGM